MSANFSDSTPSAPGGRTNVTWLKDGSGNISASIATPSTGTVTSVAVTVPAELAVSGSPITTSGTIAISKNTQTANTVWAGPSSGGAAIPNFRALVSADLPGGVGTVSSVAATVPTGFTISGSPITTSGTLAIGLSNESANLVWAGPSTGPAAAPTFRALVAADLPGGTGTVSSVALAVPTGFTVSGSPVTTTGTLTIGLSNETANTVWAGPTSGGAAAPAFRALVAADLPSGTVYTFADNETPSGTINGSNVTFTLAHTPNPSACLQLYINGVMQIASTDFTLATATITMTSAPSTGALMRAFYRY